MRKFRYKNEAEFSRVFVAHLRNKGWFVQRIETGTTGKGVPDIYAVSPEGVPYWFELKRNHEEIAGLMTPVMIHWRPGQQPWLHEVTKRKQKAMTVACFDDCILVIEHHKIYTGNKIIPGTDCVIVKSLRSL